MEMSSTISELAKALAQAQTEMVNPKETANNPFFKSKYSPLDEVLALVRPILAKHGLVVLQSPGGDGTMTTVTTTILHASGEWVRSDVLTLHPSKADAQGLGGAVTYGRRYSLAAMLGIAGAGEDDDANSISVAPQKHVAAAKPVSVGVSTKPSEPITTGPVCPTCSGPLTYMRESEFEGKPVNIHKCGNCRKLVKLVA